MRLQRLPDEVIGLIFSHLPLTNLKVLERCCDAYYWSLVPAAMFSRLLRIGATVELISTQGRDLYLTPKRRLPSSIGFGGGVEFTTPAEFTPAEFTNLFPLTILLAPAVDFNQPLLLVPPTPYQVKDMAIKIFHGSYRYVDQVTYMESYIVDDSEGWAGDEHVIFRLKNGKLSVFLSWARILAQGHPQGFCAGPALGRPLPPGHDPGQAVSLAYRLGETETLPMHPVYGRRFKMEQRLIKGGVDPRMLWKYSIVRRWIVRPPLNSEDGFEEMAFKVIQSEREWKQLSSSSSNS